MVTVDLCKSFCARKALAFSLSPVHMYVVYGLENLKTGGMTSSPDKLLVASLTIFFAWIGSSASERIKVEHIPVFCLVFVLFNQTQMWSS